MKKINLQKVDKAYFIGIKGVGVSALAQVFYGLGIEVEGSDKKEKFFTDVILERAGIEINQGFSAANIDQEIDCCVASNAYLDKNKNPNPELEKARSLNIPVFNYGEALGSLFNRAGLRLAVAGTHGKSTTTAMLASILTEQPSEAPFCVVGTELLDWQSNAWIPKREKGEKLADHSFLIEADEYKEAFLNYRPNLLVLTNIDFDHPDYFSDQESYLEAFVRLIEGMEPSDYLDFSAPVVVARAGDPNINEVLRRVDVPLKVFNFDFSKKEFDLPVPARVYQLNAAAAVKTARVLGLKESEARETLAQFGGTRRRLEKERISVRGKEIIFIDDYAHHPKEITATLEYIFDNYPKEQVRVVFQPHTFSRSKAFLDEFADALTKAKNLVLVPTYGSAREKEGEVEIEDIYRKLTKGRLSEEIYRADSLEDAGRYLADDLEKKDIVLTLGAGDVWKLKEEMKER